MQDFLLSTSVIVGLTLWLVSGIRKFVKAINGKLLVFGCGTAVGSGLSFLAALIEAHIPGGGVALAWWILLARGAGAAAVAFGYANYRQWSLAQLPTGVPKTTTKPKASAGAALLVLLALTAPVAGCAALLPILTGVIAAVADAIPIIDAIDGFVDEHFSKHEDAIHKAQVKDSIARCREALVRSERNARLCEDEPCVEEAWEPFRSSYRALETTLEATPGVEVVKALKATPDGTPGYKLLMSKSSGADLVLRDPLIMERASW
jgi:hypothetical protein